MEITDVLPRSQVLVKELAEGLNLGRCTFEQVEERILKFLYELGQGLEQEIVQGLQEPLRTVCVSGSGRQCTRANAIYGFSIALAARWSCPADVTSFATVEVGGSPWMRSWDWIVWAIPR